MEDGSRITLSPKSKISYPKRFTARQREVYINGEAFFEITKNPDRPFLVYAHGLVTKVLGTSFWVRAPESKSQVTVSVRTGRVAVFALSKLKKSAGQAVDNVLLTPNQEAVFAREAETVTRSLVENPALLTAIEPQKAFTFNSTPIADVFTTLEKAYGIAIEFDAERLKHCTLTVPLGQEPLFEKLDVICQTIGATYAVVGTRIVITAGQEACE